MWPGEDSDDDKTEQKNTASVVEHKCPRTGKMIEEWDWEKHQSTLSTEIDPQLYLGNEKNAKTREQLMYKGFEVTHILNCQRQGKKYFEDDAELNIQYLVLACDDKAHEPLGGLFGDAIKFINDAKQQGGRVLVHCDTGLSRASAFVLAYLMSASQGSEEPLTLEAAVAQVNKCRKNQFQKNIAPNHGFMRQLKQFQKELGIPN